MAGLTREQKIALLEAADKAPAAEMSREDKIALLESSDSAPTMGEGKAAKISLEKGALLGLRPLVAGAGAAAGAFSGTKGSAFDKVMAATDAFKEGRKDANLEEAKAATEYPKLSMAADVGGSLLTLPFLPAKGLSGAVKLGAGMGAAHAAGSAESLGEAAASVGFGAGTGGLAYGAGKALSKGASALADSDLLQKAGTKIKEKAKNAMLKVPSELTGISDKEIEAYATRADKVKSIIKESGGDSSLAAKHAKENILNDVQRTRTSLNSQITEALASSSPEKTISIEPILKNIRKYKERINMTLYPERMAEINELQKRITDVAGKYGEERISGKVSVAELQQIKNFLREAASPSYGSSAMGFKVGGEVANAAKSGAAEAKTLLDKFGPAEIKNANRQLQQLHEIEDHMGSNLLDPDGSHGALFAVGSGVKNHNSMALDKLGKLTGKNYLNDASDLAAARTFGDINLMPNFKTGRSLLAAGIGGMTGGPIGAAVGTALSSPAALKLAIDSGRLSSKVLQKVSSILGPLPVHEEGLLYEVLMSPQGNAALVKALASENAAAQPNYSTNIRPSSDFKK